jgi:hypothetical protein
VVPITERLTLWLSVRAAQLLEVPEIYNTMSPFMNAEQNETPFYWCKADNNPGTFTLQTERYFQALV